jgi:hypothetical protein
MNKWVVRSVVLLAAVLCIVAALKAATVETLVRLTSTEYQHSIQDIFGPSISVPGNSVDPGVRDRGLLAIGTRKLTLTASELDRYETLAQQISAQVIDARHRTSLIACKPKSETAADDACVTQFVNTVGPLLFRRQLTQEETLTYVKAANSATQTLHNFYAGVGAALEKMLVSPDFLFRVEDSDPDPSDAAKLRLDAYSKATRLSFFLWDTTPDTELLAAAKSGKLATPDGLRQQVDRLLASPKLEDGVRAFFSDMLAFDEFGTLLIDSKLFPRFTKNVEDDAREQTLKTIADHLLNKSADYRDLFTTRDTFLTPALAAVYNVPLPRSQELGGAIPWTAHHFADNDPHVGILTHISFLSLHSHPGSSSPTLRGKALRENFLCQPIPPPPPNVDFSILQQTDKYKTVRDRLTAHRSNAVCAGCHRQMDPIGLAFENFDASGMYRTAENGAPIDASGDFNGTNFKTIPELAGLIKAAPATTTCVITRAFSYGTERVPTAAERTWIGDQTTDLMKSGVKWRELMRRITLNPDFYTMPSVELQAQK